MIFWFSNAYIKVINIFTLFCILLSMQQNYVKKIYKYFIAII